MEVIFGSELGRSLKTRTFQNAFPKKLVCPQCRKMTSIPLMLIDDVDGELAKASPDRDKNGKPIWPHDSAAFALYICSDCGVVSCSWNQA